MTVTGEHSTTSTNQFLECDDNGAVFSSDDARLRVAWTDLQAHASFPADQTQITEETITTELGTFDCLRYEVTRGEQVNQFWFAIDLPGMPIKQETMVAGVVTSTTTVVSDVVT